MIDPDKELVLAAVRSLVGRATPATPEKILEWITRGMTLDLVKEHLAELESGGLVERRADGSLVTSC